MDESWRELREVPERIRWARLRTEFSRPTALAVSLNIKPGTYRTWEQLKADGGRIPPLSELQRVAHKLKVSWQWLATGDGTPFDTASDPFSLLIAARFQEVPQEKQDDARRAVEAVLDAFAKKAG